MVFQGAQPLTFVSKEGMTPFTAGLTAYINFLNAVTNLYIKVNTFYFNSDRFFKPLKFKLVFAIFIYFFNGSLLSLCEDVIRGHYASV